jgi:hypothetical protein
MQLSAGNDAVAADKSPRMPDVRSALPEIAVWLSILVLTVPLLALAVPTGRLFPSSDEWEYVSPGVPSFGWVFAQHVDHRIPIQKIFQLTVLHLFHFDFRSLIAANVLLAAVTSGLFVAAVRVYRGAANIGDIFIPLCILSFGSGYSQWGFELQFLSCLLFSAAFLFFMVMHTKGGRDSYLTLSFVMLFLCAWCGLNGMIISSFISVAVIGYLFVQRLDISVSSLSVLVATALTNAALWLFWSPSAVSTGHHSLSAIAAFSFDMVKSPFIMDASTHQILKFTIMAALAVSGAAVVLRRVLKAALPNLTDFAVLAAGGAGIVLIISTAYGRAGAIGWQPADELHYGTLAMLLPTVGWMALSSGLGKKSGLLVGIALVLLFAEAYRVSYDWRSGAIASWQAGNAAAALAIAGNEGPAQVAAQHMGWYMYIDTTQTRQMVTSGIVVLRKYERYSAALN